MAKRRRILKSNGKRRWLENYYEKHKTTIDRAVAKYKQRNPQATSAKDIFVNKLYYGNDWNSVKNAKYDVKKLINSLRGGDEEAFEAKYNASNRPSYYKSQKRVNARFDEDFTEYEFEGEDFDVLGYYDMKNSKYVVAKVRRFYDERERSPVDTYEWMKKDEIGL